MIIKIKDINNNITFELLIESNILINDLHKLQVPGTRIAMKITEGRGMRRRPLLIFS